MLNIFKFIKKYLSFVFLLGIKLNKPYFKNINFAKEMNVMWYLKFPE